ncbi:MAG: prolipoprotein diacylglyceryl transferase [Firmicutes bacterium]|nr:prolipoprotein diacylglyceryl transferase [Bacillota bacterium]
MGEVIFPNIGIYINKIDRVAFRIFGFEIYKYGLVICVGALLGVALCLYEAKRSKQNADIYSDFAFIALLSGIVGARLYYLVFYEGSILDFFKFREGGLAIYGGVLAGFIAGLIFARVKKINFLTFADTVMPSIYVGQIFGRWGNFFNREAFGSYTNGLLAMGYDVNTVAGAKVVGNTVVYNSAVYPLVTYSGTNYIMVHPTFLYESLWNLLSLVVVLFYRAHDFKHFKKQKGDVMALYFILYGFGRFFTESLRTDQLKFLGLPVSMLLSLLLFVAGVIFMIVIRIRNSRKKEV